MLKRFAELDAEILVSACANVAVVIEKRWPFRPCRPESKLISESSKREREGEHKKWQAQ